MKKGTKILLMQDQDFVCETIVRLLKSAGCEVETVDDGPAALELLGQRSYDLVVTELSLCGMSGGQLAATIRQSLPNLPIILTTTFADEYCVSLQMASGLDVLLLKPFSFDQLAAAINQALAKREQFRHL